VLALPRNSEASLFQRTNGITMIDARDLRHGLRYLDLSNFGTPEQIIADR